MGKLYVSRRDAKDAKKALEDSDEITKLPKMVMEDERMKKLTPRQRQALARVQAKPKSQVSLPKMPDFMKPKKEENEMDIVDTIRNIVEKKLDPVNPKMQSRKSLMIEKTKTSTMMVMLTLQTNTYTKDVKQYLRRLQKIRMKHMI